jgi:GntR family transcriptional regulator
MRPAAFAASGSAAASGGQAGQGSPIGFRLDPGSGVPTYLQLVQQVEEALRLGYLRRGDRLPTVKDAVQSLAINPNTVLKAYRELEHRGLAVGRPGQGTFIDGTLRRGRRPVIAGRALARFRGNAEPSFVVAAR